MALAAGALTAGACAALVGAGAPVAHADPFTEVVINPGGGNQPDGSDGLRIHLKDDAPSWGQADGHVARGQGQWCCSFPDVAGGRLILAVGSTGVSDDYFSAFVSTFWDSVDLVEVTGSASASGGTSVGSGSATLRYTATVGGLVYQIDRTVSYTYPNDFARDTYAVTIPDGNTDPVKLYYWGDTAPGGSDSGYGVMLTSPVRSIISLNTSSHVMFGFREVGAIPFAGARSEALGNQINLGYVAGAGGDIGFNAQAANHDAMLWAQWNLGSSPGVVTAAMDTFVTPQGVTLRADFREPSIDLGESTLLDFSIINTNLADATGAAFDFTLPAGLAVSGGSTANSCGGTVTAAEGSSTISLIGGTIPQVSNCVVSVPVSAPAPGTYSISAASVTSTTGMDNGVGSSSLVVVAPPTPTDAGLLGLTPSRVIDTRASGDPLMPGQIRTVAIAGSHGVPVDASAAVITATVTEPAQAGYLTLFPCGDSPPEASTLNFVAGQTVANSATMALGSGGSLCAVSTSTTNLIIDVTAAYSASAGTGLLSETAPLRLDDTRGGPKVPAGAIRTVQVAGVGGVPADATSAVVNLTITQPDADGYATIFPCGGDVPLASNVNFVAGQTAAAGATVKLDGSGALCIVPSVTTHLIVDVTAAYSPTAGDNVFIPLRPARLADSRPSAVGAGTVYEVVVAGRGGVPADAVAVALNLTIDAPDGDGYSTVYPCGGDAPLASNVNFVAGQTVANAATVSVGADGKVCVFTTAGADVIVDAIGAYEPLA